MSVLSWKKIPAHEKAGMCLVKLATEKFGENNVPDGKGVNFIIEDNVINGNGKAGGGSLNLAGLQDSLIQSNLIYGNFNHGIAQWGDANPYDATYVEPDPMSPDQVKTPSDLPLWGCHGNLIRNNTVLMNNTGRAAMQCRNGSWGTKMRNNIFINDQPFSLEVFNTSVYRLDSSFNVINTADFANVPDSLKLLRLNCRKGSRQYPELHRKRRQNNLSLITTSHGSSSRGNGGGSTQTGQSSAQIRAQTICSLG